MWAWEVLPEGQALLCKRWRWRHRVGAKGKQKSSSGCGLDTEPGGHGFSVHSVPSPVPAVQTVTGQPRPRAPLQSTNLAGRLPWGHRGEWLPQSPCSPGRASLTAGMEKLLAGSQRDTWIDQVANQGRQEARVQRPEGRGASGNWQGPT